MNEPFQWNQSDRYRSNNGAGPLTARILRVVDGAATMERWHTDPRKAVRFELLVSFLQSERCGWKLIPQARAPV